ncbi:MAG: DNA replication protein [Rhizobiales bacterium]|nr:DNA replication protein [Hyphomicrobiales bacterium]
MSGKNRKPAKRMAESQQPDINAFRARHLALAQRQIATELGAASVLVDEGESPLAWLARRRGGDGRSYSGPHQLQAGERLRADFTCANLMPRTTSNWASPISSDKSGSNRARDFTETMVAARRRVQQALDTVGPEFAGLLLDVCCFLKKLDDVERERAWPTRSAKVVLQLALDRLARHYGYAAQASGRAHAPVRTWLAEDAEFGVDGTLGVDS